MYRVETVIQLAENRRDIAHIYERIEALYKETYMQMELLRQKTQVQNADI